jgi:5-methylcytosine-specific restriction endonuclease McrA
MQGKTCSKCGTHYTDIPANFQRGKGYRDGFQGTCKACRRARERERYARSPAKHLAQKRARVAQMETPPAKVCRTCGKRYDDVAANFHRHNSVGFHPDCKACRKIEAKRRHAGEREENRAACAERYRNNKERYSEQNRAWREANRERYLELNRNYYRRNRRVILGKMKAARDANPEADRERSRQWRRKNPEKARALSAKHRRLRLDAPGSHTAEDVRWRYEIQKGCCYWCRKNVGDEYHVDHVIPISRGGSDGRENIVIACPTCNRSKHNKMPEEFAGVLL